MSNLRAYDESYPDSVIHPPLEITSISPTSHAINAGTFTLTVNGTAFLVSSVVEVDNVPSATTYVSRNRVTAIVPSAGETVGVPSQVVVKNGGDGSNPAQLTWTGTAGDPEPGPFDPGKCSIAEVLAYLDEHPDETEAVLDAEEQGKNRVRLVTELEERFLRDEEERSSS